MYIKETLTSKNAYNTLNCKQICIFLIKHILKNYGHLLLDKDNAYKTLT